MTFPDVSVRRGGVPYDPDDPLLKALRREQAEINAMREDFMHSTLADVVGFLRTPRACACTGGFRRYPAPCFCQMQIIAAKQALASCGIRVRNADADVD